MEIKRKEIILSAINVRLLFLVGAVEVESGGERVESVQWILKQLLERIEEF